MKTKPEFKRTLILALASVIIVISSAFNTAAGQKGPVKLVYSFPAGKAITYNMTTVVTQTMDIQGQTMNVFVNTNLGFKLKLMEKQGDNLKLEVTIDSLSTKVESMAGSTGGKMKEVEGKSFNMIISPLGKVVDISEASKIEYSVEGQANVNVSSAFANVLPVLPDNTVKPGDTWEKNDTIVTNASGGKTTLMVKSANKYEGVEKINGIECAKIVSGITGTMQINAQNMGMDIVMNGTTQGQIILYFAIKDGYYVKQEVTQKMSGTAEISGPQSMSFPITIETVTTSVAK
jgi:hypothetical protein